MKWKQTSETLKIQFFYYILNDLGEILGEYGKTANYSKSTIFYDTFLSIYKFLLQMQIW